MQRHRQRNILDPVPATDFIRVHKSYVVAIRHISLIEVHQLTVSGIKIPIGSTYREDVRQILGVK
ncbi:MAG: LytTR family transcriptional regulator DNA-binding domain-containing protein [Bacteroidota bacterium]